MAYKRKRDDWWYASFTMTYPDGSKERIRRRSPRNSKRAAEAFERELQQQLLEDWTKNRLGISTIEVPTLEEFRDEFLDVYAVNNNKQSTVETKRNILRLHLVPFFGDMKLDAISPRDIERYKAKKKREGLSPKTIKNQLGVMQKMLNVALDWEMIQKVPKIEPPKQPKKQFQFWDFEETERVLEVIDTEPRIANIIRLALGTGLRLGELCGLQWGDVDLKAKRPKLEVRRQYSRKRVSDPKNGSIRTVPLSELAITALKKQKPRTFMKTDWVFYDDGRFNQHRIHDGFERIIKKAGVKRIRFHDLRHTFASHAAMRGVPIPVLQKWLGHKNLSTTMGYAHLTPEYQYEFIDLMDGDGDENRVTNVSPS